MKDNKIIVVRYIGEYAKRYGKREMLAELASDENFTYIFGDNRPMKLGNDVERVSDEFALESNLTFLITKYKEYIIISKASVKRLANNVRDNILSHFTIV